METNASKYTPTEVNTLLDGSMHSLIPPISNFYMDSMTTCNIFSDFADLSHEHQDILLNSFPDLDSNTDGSNANIKMHLNLETQITRAFRIAKNGCL
jgi:hypothetical protein